ncbi:MAG: hypothetical protein DRR42_21660 [Gammaproteobacteria bacterium]|nr:MAG: hypothetical protein DRR42_21660 [Gammaproteobacteria bacterium]
MGIDFFAYEVASKFNSYTLFKNVSVHEPVSTDKVNLLRSNWVKEHEKIGESFFRQKRSGSDIENLISFVKYQAKNILPKEFNRDKKNIAIFSGTIDEYAGVDGWNNIYESDETAGLQRILESFQSDSRYMFYLRVHPNMKGLPSSNSQLMDIHALSIRFSNLCVIWPEDIIDSYALMDACEKIIVFSSTMGVEATYWGKPSISAGSAFYENFNCVYRPKTHEELITLLLDNDIKPLTVDSALQYAFWQLSNGVHFEYFKKERDKNGFERITLDGVEIKADALPRLWHWIHLFPSRLKRVVLKPSLIFSKVTRIFKIKS